MPSLRSTITDEQFEWLAENQDSWYSLSDVTIAKYSTWTYLVILIQQPGTTIITDLHLNNDGTTAFSGTHDISSSTYWKGVFEGTETANMYYYYINHGDLPVDSYETLGIPEIDYVYDEDELIPLRSIKFNIFNSLKNYCSYFTDPSGLNAAYMTSRGRKYASELILSHLSQAKTLSSSSVEQIAKYAYEKFGVIWDKLWTSYEYAYDPLTSFNKVEEHSQTDTETQTPTSWKKTDESLAANNIETDQNQVYGFNSSSPVDESKQERTFAHKNTSEQSGTYETKTEYGHKITTSGNLAFNPSELIESFRDMAEFDFFEHVFNDLDSILTKNYLGGIK